MDEPMEARQGADLRDYLAVERTFLAWIRTGIALMGFGFVVARFGLFLQQLQVLQHAPSAPSYGLSLWFGTALITLGVVVNLFSAWNHFRLVRELEQGRVDRSRPSAQAILVALFLALVGLGMATYLVSLRSSASLPPEIHENVSVRPAGRKGLIDRAWAWNPCDKHVHPDWA